MKDNKQTSQLEFSSSTAQHAVTPGTINTTLLPSLVTACSQCNLAPYTQTVPLSQHTLVSKTSLN